MWLPRNSLLPAQVRGLQRGFIKRLIRLSSSTLSTLGRVLLKLGYDCTAGPDGKALQFLRELGAYLARCDAAGGLLPVAKHVGTTFQEFYDALNYDLFAQASTTPAAAAEREARRSADGEEGWAAAVKMQICMAGMDDKTIMRLGEEAWLGGGGPDGTYGIGEDDGEFGYTDEYHGNTFDFPGHLDHDVHRWLDDPTYDPKSLEDFDDNTPFDEFGRDLE